MVKTSKAFLSKSSLQTKKIGKSLAEKILKVEKDGKKAVVLALEGDLGGGKTTFLQGFARGLKIKQKITSPTFVILKRFSLKGKNFKSFYHIDCYRLQKPKEILGLGFKEIISSPRNIIAVEWAEKLKKIFPRNALVIKFGFVSRNKRKIRINVIK